MVTKKIMLNLERPTTTKKKGDTVQMQEVYNQQGTKRQSMMYCGCK